MLGCSVSDIPRNTSFTVILINIVIIHDVYTEDVVSSSPVTFVSSVLTSVRFESQPMHRLYLQRIFHIFFHSFRQIPGQYLEYARKTCFEIFSKSSVTNYSYFRSSLILSDSGSISNRNEMCKVRCYTLLNLLCDEVFEIC
jgi:hypothetical protein